MKYALNVIGRKHFQLDLAEELNCSPQTIIRLMSEIESVVGISLESGKHIFINIR